MLYSLIHKKVINTYCQKLCICTLFYKKFHSSSRLMPFLLHDLGEFTSFLRNKAHEWSDVGLLKFNRKKVGMAKLNWILNYHIYEPVGFILDLKIGMKDIRQIYTLHALLFTEQRTLAENNLIVEDYQNLTKNKSENSI